MSRWPDRRVSAIAVGLALALSLGAGPAARAEDQPPEPAPATEPSGSLQTDTPVEPIESAAPPPSGASRFRPITPCRLLDTRIDRSQPVARREVVRVQVGGRCGTPTNASAAVVSLTVTETTERGYLTAFPAGTSRPTASNLNYLANATVANSAVVLLRGGAIDVYLHGGAELVVDVSGVFLPADRAVNAGRFVPVDPSRLLDTREVGRRGDGPIRVPLPAGVPSDATAVVANVTIVDAARRGFISAYVAGSARQTASVQNADDLHRTRAVTVIVPVGPRGFTIHRSMVSDLVVDISGWFTGTSAPTGTDGLLVPQAPVRVRDSRLSFDPPHTRGTIHVDELAGTGAAVVANLTTVETVAPGFVTAHPSGFDRPATSNLNPRWRAPLANLALVPMSADGISLYAHRGSHVIVDVVGTFTGPALPLPTPPQSTPPNAMPANGGRVLFVSDSAFASIRWLGQLDMLQGATFTADLESCRRLIGTSCRGREGYSPSTAVQAIRAAQGGFDTLVVTAGYNDYAGTFEGAVHQVLAAARAKGIKRIVWLTYRQDVSYVSPYGASWAGTFTANNATLRQIVASGTAPEIEIAEWHETTTDAPTDWFAGDRLHLTTAGARGAATYISRKLAHLERRPCPAGLGGATTPGGWCADPDDAIQFTLPPEE